MRRCIAERISAGWWTGFGSVLALTAVIRLAGASAFAVTPSYLCERFPAALRGSGFGLGYSTPLVLTSFYAYYQNWLGAILPRGLTASALLVLGGALVLVGALLGPESRNVELGTETGTDPTPAPAEPRLP